MFHRPDPVMERRLVVPGHDRHGLLGHDRAPVERGVDEMDRGATDRDPMGERVAHGVSARERGEQRRCVLRTRPGKAARTRGPTIRM